MEILVLEDEESVNRGIAFTLRKEGYDVWGAGTIREARRILEEHPIYLLICDINLPDGSGLDFVREVRKRSRMHIICLTALDQETDQVMGYEAGADDYVVKPFSLSVLVLKVQAYFKRHRAEEGQVIESGELWIDLLAGKVRRGGEEISLTQNEWRLLGTFLEHPGQILSRDQLLERLFDGDGEFVDSNTLAVNIRRLREKIETDGSRPDYIKNIRGLGYIWDCPCVRI